MKRHPITKVALLGLAGALHAHAELLVYEPFDYPPDEILTGKGGAKGTTGTWLSHDTITGDGKTQDWFVHAEGMTSGVGLSGQNGSSEPSGLHRWDGTVENLPTSGGYAGLWGADDWNDDDPFNGEPGRNLDANIGLDPAVTATFQAGATTWFSYVAVRGWDRNEETPSLILGTDPTPNDSRGASLTNGGSGIGTGGGPPRNHRTQIYPMYFSGGNPYTLNGQVLSFTDDAKGPPADGQEDWLEVGPDTFFGPVNIVIGKIEWDADAGGADIISVTRFLEDDMLSEAAFDALIAAKPNLSSANWTANKPDLDQSQFDTLSIAGLKFFVDEVRIGTTFDDVIKGGVAPEIPLQLVITTTGPDLEIEWASNPGMFYNLRSSADLGADLSTWDVVEVGGMTDLPHTAPLNTVTIARPADPTRFYRVEEFALPPVTVFTEDFDSTAAGNLPAGWTTGFDVTDTAMTTVWQLGDPSGGAATGPLAAHSGANCVGTNLVANYGPESNTWLRTPAIDLSAAAVATMSFRQWVDIDNFPDPISSIVDHGSVRILDGSALPGTVTELAVVEAEITGFDGIDGWVEYSAALPAPALGAVIALEFGFVSNADDLFPSSGWYIDDVLINMPAP